MKPENNKEINDIIKAIKSLDEKLKAFADANEDRISEQHDDIVEKYGNGTSENGVLLNRKLVRMIRSVNDLNLIIENRKLLKQVLGNMEYIKNGKFCGYIP